MGFPNTINGSEERIFDDLVNEDVPVGSKMVLADGRLFRFSENAGTALVVGSVNQGAVPSTNTTTEVIDTLAAGVTILTGVGATAGAQAPDLLKYGYIYTDNAVTLPAMRIKSNANIASGGTGNVTLFTKTPTAIAAGNTVSYFVNPWRDVIIHDSPATAVYTGVCKTALTADQFGWLQTAGPCSVLYDATTTAIAVVNDPVVGDVNVDGAVAGAATAVLETDPIIGYQLGVVEGDGEQNLIFLVIE